VYLFFRTKLRQFCPAWFLSSYVCWRYTGRCTPSVILDLQQRLQLNINKSECSTASAGVPLLAGSISFQDAHSGWGLIPLSRRRLFEILEFISRLGFKTCLSNTKTQQFQDPDKDQDSAVWRPRPRPRPRLWCPRPRTIFKTYKTNTGSPWLGWTVTNKKTEKVMTSRKSSIPVVAHSKQQDITPCLTTVLFPQLPLIIAVYQTLARTHNITKVRCLIYN